MKQKRINIKKGILTVTLLSFVASSCFAFGETGCKINPNKEKGDCKKNTEGTYDCYPAWWFPDCTSS